VTGERQFTIAVARAGPRALPEWLISYPLGATRVQFIAHYEVVYRVDPCPEPGTARPKSTG